MKKNNLFYKYYDTLYSSKNYAGEAQYFLSAAKQFSPNPVKKILEIGAGTGNHTIALAKSHAEIIAIDTDKNMVEIALRKIIPLKAGPKIRIRHTTIENLKEKNFDLAIAGFNVVNYVSDINSLISFFSAIQSRLKKNAVFIFDCWNGIAAIIDPPKSKLIHGKKGDDFVMCTVSSETDFMKQKTQLTYDITISNNKGKKNNSGVFSLEQTLWTPMELNHCLKIAGFKVLKCSHNLQPEIPAKETDWKIMFLCKKM